MDGVYVSDNIVTNDTHNHGAGTLAGSDTTSTSGTTSTSLGGGDGIVYEPWNLDITLSEFILTDHKIFFIQFFAPASGTYTDLNLFTTYSSSSTYTGTIGVGIFEDIPGNPGSPYILVGGGTQTFASATNMQRKHVTVNFIASATLTKPEILAPFT